MLERPDLDDDTLRAALEDGFGIAVARLEFTPLGNDSVAWTYRAVDRAHGAWFVKVRRERRAAAVEVAAFLHDNGLPEVVAARRTTSGDPWLSVGPWTVLVYPFVDAPRAMDAGLDRAGWRRLGEVASRLHASVLPARLAERLPPETFEPKMTDLARQIASWVADGDRRERSVDDELVGDVVRTWSRHQSVLSYLVTRAEGLGADIRSSLARDPDAIPFVVCHADLHTGNVLVGPDESLHVIDWDEVMLAPRERDLMFIRDSIVAGLVSDAEATAFEAGYGSASPDPVLIAYYRIDWAIQDISDFARRVILDPSLGPQTRARAAELFRGQFEPGGEVDWALAADASIGGSPPPRPV